MLLYIELKIPNIFFYKILWHETLQEIIERGCLKTFSAIFWFIWFLSESMLNVCIIPILYLQSSRNRRGDFPDLDQINTSMFSEKNSPFRNNAITLVEFFYIKIHKFFKWICRSLDQLYRKNYYFIEELKIFNHSDFWRIIHVVIFPVESKCVPRQDSNLKISNPTRF